MGQVALSGYSRRGGPCPPEAGLRPGAGLGHGSNLSFLLIADGCSLWVKGGVKGPCVSLPCPAEKRVLWSSWQRRTLFAPGSPNSHLFLVCPFVNQSS